ncbi:MAG: acylphosphatase [Chitinophagales bacterium]
MKSLQIKVEGNVQGVYFRMSTKEKADQLGLKGFAKNEKDGSVYIEVEGEEVILEKLIEWLHVGPPNANVTKVSIEDQPIIGYVDFVIRRH